MTKILLVTSRMEAIGNLMKLFHEEHFSVCTASTIDTALDLIATELPGVILCDAESATLDKYKFLKTVRAQPISATTGFIFLTENITEPERRRGINLGADDYLRLPCTPQEIIDTVHSRLARQQAFQEHERFQLEKLRRNLTIALPHELRTPLQGIITSSELLGEYWQTLDPEDIADITKNITTSAGRLNQLIQKFLDYFKLDLIAGDIEQCRQWQQQSATGTSKLLIQVLGQKVAKKYQRYSDLCCDLSDATISISQKWLSILVEELLDNAFKFSQPEMLKWVEKTFVEVTSHIEGDRWILKIQDHGRGMAENEIQAIGAYMQFNRMRYEQQGSGLGLAIAERIVKIYNGTMTINSTSNKGTLVTVSLPLYDDTGMEDLSVIG